MQADKEERLWQNSKSGSILMIRPVLLGLLVSALRVSTQFHRWNRHLRLVLTMPQARRAYLLFNTIKEALGPIR